MATENKRGEKKHYRKGALHPVLASLCREFLLHILCWLLCVGSFSYTSHAGRFRFMWDIYLTFPCQLLYVGSFFLHILCWLYNVGSFSYKSHAGCIMWGVSLTHPVLASLCGEFFLHILCWRFYIYVGYLFYISMLASLCWWFFLHIL